MNQILRRNSSSKRGVTLLIAVLLTAAVLGVGLGVYQRTYKEALFASFWKQTQIAAAAADGGLECALYWDLHTSSLDSSGNATCFNSALIKWNPSSFSVTSPGFWSFQAPLAGGKCVKVTITKYTPILPTDPTTKIEARGYNAPCSDVDAGTNLRIVERGLYVQY